MKVACRFVVAVAFAWSSFSQAGQMTLMISIDKEGVKPNKVQEAVEQLNHKDPETGPCFVDSTVTEYIDYEFYSHDAPYYGVAIVNFVWQCDGYARDFLMKIEESMMYTIYSNATVGPGPAVSGSN